MTTPNTEQASALLDPDHAGVAAAHTGDEIVTMKQSGGVVQTTLTKIAQFVQAPFSKANSTDCKTAIPFTSPVVSIKNLIFTVPP